MASGEGAKNFLVRRIKELYNLDNIIDSIEKVLVLTENQKDLIKKELGE